MGTGVAMITASLKANAVSGRVFFSAGDGVLKKIDLHADKGGVVTVDNDSIVAYSADLLCAPKISGSGLSSVFFGKEGIVYDFAGKGTIYVGSMPQDLEQKNTCQLSAQPHNVPALEPESGVKRYR